MRNSVHWFVCVSACLCGTLLHAVERGGPPQAAATDHFSLGSARRHPASGTLRATLSRVKGRPPRMISTPQLA
jgi:hypothetical protein